MRSGVGLCVLGLLGLYSLVFGEAKVQPGVLIFCDDPSVEKAANSAVHKFNKKLTTGNILALYQILTASKSENGSDSVYSLQFTTRRSDCQAGSSKSWTDCDYLTTGPKEPISCNATVYVTETEADTKQVDCLLDNYIVPEKAPCLGCPQEIDQYSDDLRGPLTTSISKYNTMSDSTHLFTLHSVGHATRQVLAGLRFRVRFDMRKSICAKDEHKDLTLQCVPDENNVEFANCNSTVDVAPWRHEPPQIQIECEQGALASVFVRRRPPGWSPLRNFLFEVPPTPSLPTIAKPTASSSAASPSKASAKEESSEEDTTAAKTSGSADVVVSAADDSPFHCPSKPWKPFNPVDVVALAPTEAAAEASPKPVADGTFSDADLTG